MKFKLLFILFLSTSLLSAQTNSNSNQDSKKLFLILNGALGIQLSDTTHSWSQSVYWSDTSDTWNLGLGGGIGLGLHLNNNTALILKYDLDYHSLNEKGFCIDQEIIRSNIEEFDGGSLTNHVISANIRYHFGKTPLYVTGGVGYYIKNISDLTVIPYEHIGTKTVYEGSSENGFAFNAGFGATVKASEKTHFFIETKYSGFLAKDIEDETIILSEIFILGGWIHEF